jgi:hypothetical protein
MALGYFVGAANLSLHVAWPKNTTTSALIIKGRLASPTGVGDVDAGRQQYATPVLGLVYIIPTTKREPRQSCRREVVDRLVREYRWLPLNVGSSSCVSVLDRSHSSRWRHHHNSL